jgi:hypothetical protein
MKKLLFILSFGFYFNFALSQIITPVPVELPIKDYGLIINNLPMNDEQGNFRSTLILTSAKISVDSAINFPETDTNKSISYPMEINNIGDENLVISNIEINDDTDGFFSCYIEMYPLIINPGKKEVVNINFYPKKSGVFTCKIKITSNDNPAIVYLSGKGKYYGTDVSENFSTGKFELLTKQTLIKKNCENIFRLSISTPDKLDIQVYALTGAEVRLPQSYELNAGENDLFLRFDDLTDGCYFLVFRSSNKIISLPVVLY